MMTTSPARLFVLLARQAPIGVILRRGPSDWVQMIKWHTDTDKFEAGQWFHGRIYEQLADLSPNGKWFTYHAFKPNNAAKNPSYGNRWTALSVPPKFTALSLWPFHGYDESGGAYFKSNDTIVLNHHQDENQHYHFKHVPPKPLTVVLPSEWSDTGRESNDLGTLHLLLKNQLFEHRLDRDGWKGKNRKGGLGSRHNRRFYALELSREGDKNMWGSNNEPSPTWFKGQKGSPFTISISRTRHFLHHVLTTKPKWLGAYRYDKQRTKLTYEYILMNSDLTDLYAVEGITWADFDQQGRLVLAKEGKLFTGTLYNGEIQLTELADFNANKPDPQPAPEWAQKW